MSTNRKSTRAAALGSVIALIAAAGAIAPIAASAAAPRQSQRTLAERAARERQQTLGAAPARAGQPGEVNYTFQSDTDGKSVRLEMSNGEIVKAELDGKPVPDNRIERDGDSVRFKDEAGKVVFEHTVPAAPRTAGAGAWSGSLFTPGGPQARAFVRGQTGGGGQPGIAGAHAAVEPAEPPKVMVGIQMATPDPTLRGHLGLKDGAASMLNAVHKGLPADAVGLGPYDVIVAVEGKDQAGPNDIRAALKNKQPGDTIRLGVIQKGVRKDLTIKLEAYDRKKLNEAEVRAIADNMKWGDFGQGVEGLAPFLQQGLAGGGKAVSPEQLQAYIEQYRAGRADGGPFIGVTPGPDGGPLLLEPGRAWRNDDQFRAEAQKERSAQMEGLQRQLQEMQRMMERMMNEKSWPGRSEQPDRDAPPPRQREGRS